MSFMLALPKISLHGAGAIGDMVKLVANKQWGTALIVTDGHWATRLRYQQKRLQRQLQAFDEFASLTRILFKVQPPTVLAKVAGHTLDLSENAAQTIQATAEGITDPALRAALERLASHAKPKPDPA